MSAITTTGQLQVDSVLTRIDDTCFVANNAVIIGDVWVLADASIWFGVTIRGDQAPIRIGARSNVQDGSVIHASAGYPCMIGDDVTIGHRSVIHGARIAHRTLIGMSSTIMNGAVISEQCIVAAGSVVPEGMIVPPRSLVVGVPAKVVRELTQEEIDTIAASSGNYVQHGRVYRESVFRARQPQPLTLHR